MYFSQWCKLCQEALNPRDWIFWSVTWQLGHLEITAALYFSCGMFPNNSENIYNLRKLHQLLFHFCQQDTLFTQHLNHNSDCKQCPGNLVLTLDWNLCLCRSVCTPFISTAVPGFFKCSSLLKLISHDIHFIIIVVLDIYKYTDFCCMEKVGKVPPNVAAELPIKPFATVCESQHCDFVTPPWFCDEHLCGHTLLCHLQHHGKVQFPLHVGWPLLPPGAYFWWWQYCLARRMHQPSVRLPLASF